MNPITETQKLIKKFLKEHASKLKKIPVMSEKLMDVCDKIERTWSGSFAGWHGKMYFRDFQIPSIHQRFSGEWGGLNGIPDGWEEKEPEVVQARIEKMIGDNFSTKEFENNIEKLREEANKLREEINITFSSFDFSSNMLKEKELFGKMDDFQFGKTKGEYIQERLPGTMMSRDAEALRQGKYIATWLYFEGVALEGKSVFESINKFIALTNRLIKQLIMKKDSASKTPYAKDQLRNLHREIYNKCYGLYKKKAYAEAAEKSFKVVRDRLRKLTSYETGSEAFGKGKLHIKGAAAQNVDKDFNEAVKFLTMAIDNFRNEKSHTSDARIDDPIRAYEYLRLSSLAMNLLEDVEILP